MDQDGHLAWVGGVSTTDLSILAPALDLSPSAASLNTVADEVITLDVDGLPSGSLSLADALTRAGKVGGMPGHG